MAFSLKDLTFKNIKAEIEAKLKSLAAPNAPGAGGAAPSSEAPDAAAAKSSLRLFLSFSAGILVFVGMIAFAVFFIAVKGRDEVMVPDVTGKELIPALLELQRKELYPRIQLRHSDSGDDKGLVLEQEPGPGNLVRAERRINLVVSAGVSLEKVGVYIGRNVSDVRADVAALPLVNLREPFLYQYAPESPGVILQQSPPPGTDLTGPVDLELVVSRGLENPRVAVPDVEGLTLEAAVERLVEAGAVWTFELIPTDNAAKAETVAAQSPWAGTEIDAAARIVVSLYAPLPAEGEAAGLFRWTLPRNPYPLPVTLDALLPGGARRRLAAAAHPGGEFTFPYRLPAGSTLVLSMLGTELGRVTIENGEEE